jgi:hypothetical protein
VAFVATKAKDMEIRGYLVYALFHPFFLNFLIFKSIGLGVEGFLHLFLKVRLKNPYHLFSRRDIYCYTIRSPLIHVGGGGGLIWPFLRSGAYLKPILYLFFFKVGLRTLVVNLFIYLGAMYFMDTYKLPSKYI